jgi:CBS domain-containing protein
MDDVFVGSLMSSPVRTVEPTLTLQEAAATMLDHGVGSLVVVDDEDRLAGVLTGTDFLSATADGIRPDEEHVADYMTRDVVTTTINTSVTTVADEIIEHGFHHLPVVDGEGGVIGMISTTDLTAYVSGVVDPSP